MYDTVFCFGLPFYSLVNNTKLLTRFLLNSLTAEKHLTLPTNKVKEVPTPKLSKRYSSLGGLRFHRTALIFSFGQISFSERFGEDLSSISAWEVIQTEAFSHWDIRLGFHLIGALFCSYSRMGH